MHLVPGVFTVVFVRVGRAQGLWETPWQPQAAPAQVQELWLASWPGSGPQKRGMQRACHSPPLLAGREGAQHAARYMLCTWRSLPSQAGNKVNTPGIQQNPKDDVKLYKSNVGASADSTGLMFFTSDLGKKEDSCWDKELVLSSNYFSSKRLVSGSFSQQNGALLPLCLCWSLLLCVREWAVSVGGWCADSTSLQIICRLQVKCRSESITEQELVFILR